MIQKILTYTAFMLGMVTTASLYSLELYNSGISPIDVVYQGKNCSVQSNDALIVQEDTARAVSISDGAIGATLMFKPEAYTAKIRLDLQTLCYLAYEQSSQLHRATPSIELELVNDTGSWLRIYTSHKDSSDAIELFPGSSWCTVALATLQTIKRLGFAYDTSVTSMCYMLHSHVDRTTSLSDVRSLSLATICAIKSHKYAVLKVHTAVS